MGEKGAERAERSRRWAKRLAINVEEASAFVGVSPGTGGRLFGGRSTRRSAFDVRDAAFRFVGDAATGRDSLRVAKLFERGVGTRREVGFATEFDGTALRRENKGVSGDVHCGVPWKRWRDY